MANQFEFVLEPTAAGVSSASGDGITTAGLSGAIADGDAAGVALLDGLALRRGCGGAVRGGGAFVVSVTGGAVGTCAADVGNLAMAVNVVAVSATVKLHA